MIIVYILQPVVSLESGSEHGQTSSAADLHLPQFADSHGARLEPEGNGHALTSCSFKEQAKKISFKLHSRNSVLGFEGLNLGL